LKVTENDFMWDRNGGHFQKLLGLFKMGNINWMHCAMHSSPKKFIKKW
jgi:hypothetical protein